MGNDWTNETEVPSGGKVRADGRKDVAAMKCGRDGSLNHPVLIGDFACRVQTVAVNYGGDQSVVWENKILALFRFHDDGFARSADSRVDDGDKNGSWGIVGGHGFKEARAFFDGIGRDLMGDVHDAGLRGDAGHHGFADGHGIVGGAEVAHEDDRGTWSRWRDGGWIIAPRNL